MIFHAGNYVHWDLHRTDWLIDTQPWVNPGDNPFNGDHDLACGSPLTHRDIDLRNIEDFFYHCNGHVMTAFSSSGYSIISFTPDRVFTDISRVCWDVNSTDQGGGRWTNMVVVPEAVHQQFVAADVDGGPRLDYVTPGFNANNGPGDFNIQQQDHDGTIYGLKDHRGVLSWYENDSTLWQSSWNPANVTEDETSRFTKCVAQTDDNELTISIDRPTGHTDVFTIAGTLPDGDVRVIFQDDQYNGPKRGGFDEFQTTWHWDNIEVR